MAYNANEPRMSKREKELTDASNDGQWAFRNGAIKPLHIAGDDQLSQAWENGYRIAGERAGRVFKYAD